MPFGLWYASDNLQLTLDLILSGVQLKSFLVYLYDLLIFSKSTEDHIKNVEEVLQLLRDGAVSLKIRKCSFSRKSVDYLGHSHIPRRLAVGKDST